MDKQKQTFIESLMTNKKLNPGQRERVLALAARELGVNGSTDLVERVERIEGVVFSAEGKEVDLTREKAEENDLSNKPKRKSRPGNPKHVAQFMSLFNKEDDLKYLTHDYHLSEGFDFSSFIKKAKKSFKVATYLNLNIPPSLYAIVNNFAFSDEEWTTVSEDYSKDVKIDTGWSSLKIKKWSISEGKHPINNDEFRGVINDFRRITRVERNQLDKLVDTCMQTVFSGAQEELYKPNHDLSKADFYTHVRFLKRAFIEIFKEIKVRTENIETKKITVDFERDTELDVETGIQYYVRRICITHFGSFPNKEEGILTNEWVGGKGCMGAIKANLEGYCHWSIETCIEGRPTRVNILRDKSTNLINYGIQNPGGFKHVLTFYYQ